jgi:hypothetical protein
MFIFLAEGQWFSPGTSVSSTNKTDCQDITEILLKVPLNSITLIMFISQMDIVLEMAHKVDDTGNNIDLVHKLLSNGLYILVLAYL